MDAITLLLFLAGFALLIVGAELLVRGASGLAAQMGVSPLVIGLTVVAFGTSAPEAAVSAISSLAGQPDIALGNVIGSNIFNVLFILGISALITPLIVARQLVQKEVPFMIGVSLLLYAFAAGGVIAFWESLLLFAGAILYTLYLIRQSRKELTEDPPPTEPAKTGTSLGVLVWQIALVMAGLGMLVLGSRWLVGGATSLARVFGLSELVIGLTIVAAGTSLPEVATSIMAAVRGERDIAVGNVVGSNIFNILFVLGFAGVVSPGGIPVSTAVLGFDLPVMLAVCVACLPIFFTGHLIARWEGALFLAYYVAYTAYLLLQAAQHDALPLYSEIMAEFVLPLTGITLVVIALRAWRDRRPAGDSA
jgi:cation:H+ antiporter